MPTYLTGDMMQMIPQVDYFVITTNAIIKRDGALVMGAGIAKQVRDSNPGIDKLCGRHIRQYAADPNVYGFIQVESKLCLFQVKHHYKDKADLGIIRLSASQLGDHARANPDKIYALNFPGIGNGKLNYNDVKPIIDELPDNVTVWTFK